MGKAMQVTRLALVVMVAAGLSGCSYNKFTTQEEVDYFWERLTEGGEPGPCSWLKDK